MASATSYGVINKTRPNSPALSLLRLPRSLNATAPKAQRNLPAFTSYVCLMRAREAPSSGATDRPAGAPMRLTRSSRRCGCRPTSTRRILFRAFHFSDFRIGANDGARAVSGAGEVANDVDGDRRRRVSAGLVGAAAGEVGGERHELRGHQQNAAKFSGTLTATLASLAQRYGSESSAEFARVHQLCLSHACARGAIERCHRPTRRCADATDAIEPALRLPADVDAPDFFRAFHFSFPSGLAGPAAHETLLLCGCVVGIEVGIHLVRLSPTFSWTRGSWSTSDCRHGPSSAPEHAS